MALSSQIDWNSHKIPEGDRGTGKSQTIYLTHKDTPGSILRSYNHKTHKPGIIMLEAERPGSCFGCCFKMPSGACDRPDKYPTCVAYNRYDHNWVIFKEIGPDGSIK